MVAARNFRGAKAVAAGSPPRDGRAMSSWPSTPAGRSNTGGGKRGFHSGKAAPKSPTIAPQMSPHLRPAQAAQLTPPSTPWKAPLDSGAGFPAAVIIRGLPGSLCVGPALEAMLEQANLEDVLLSFNVRTTTPVSEVLVHLSCEQAARRCASHFDGRQWGAGGTTLKAILVECPAADTDVSADGLFRTMSHVSHSSMVSTSCGVVGDGEGCSDSFNSDEYDYDNGYVTDDGF
eukprot:TRINITY_DN47386_c0_g1_i1.p1 TRINITY_DN47386_c0_g1~~TRINITY_DN47386_c0_g1_i1.p1  ORF type:complete len:232 (-),score=39.90 TRINITY_DN47386_c0_g1_i1:172-867(-)